MSSPDRGSNQPALRQPEQGATQRPQTLAEVMLQSVQEQPEDRRVATAIQIVQDINTSIATSTTGNINSLLETKAIVSGQIPEGTDFYPFTEQYRKRYSIPLSETVFSPTPPKQGK